MFSRFTCRAAVWSLALAPIVAAAQQPDAPARPRQPAAGAVPPQPGSKADLQSFEQKLSYALGVNVGRTMQRDGLTPDPEMFMRGFRDSFQEGDPLLSDEEMKEVFAEVQKQMQDKVAAAQKKTGEEWSASFGDEKKPKGEPKATKSGLKYEVFAEGKGPKPKATDVVTVHYVGKLPDGKVFDSSIARGEPAQFPLDQVIKGWTEGVQLMPVGSKYKFYVPAAMAYGERGAGDAIGPNQDLVFEVQLIDIAEAPPAETPPSGDPTGRPQK